MRKILTLLFLFLSSEAICQSNLIKITDSITAEGKILYRSEMASWYGTDIFLEQYKNHENIGGYFSYSENEKAKCIFFSKSEIPKVIGTMLFDSTFNIKTANVNLTERDFTRTEIDLYTIRKNALEIVQHDTLFKVYKNTNLNLIPLIYNGGKKVYILTGPKVDGVVIFGNDYLLLYNQNNQLINRKILHNNIIWINYGEKLKDMTETIGTMHSHLPETGNFITATDICTLMLYEKFAKWKSHFVISANYVSIWNCKDDSLFIMTREAWDKIYKDKKGK